MSATGTDVPVVALVCSAGGLEALSSVLAGLPTSLPAAVVALRHQDPAVVSHLAAILDRHSALPVDLATDGAPLRPGTVVVVPAGRHALATSQGTLVLVESGALPPYRPSADLLLATLAVALGPRVVAVVLSGAGNDGATGAEAVHRLGGVVIAADEASSRETGMPRAAVERDEAVDWVLPVERIAGLVVDLTRRGVLVRDAGLDRTWAPWAARRSPVLPAGSSA